MKITLVQVPNDSVYGQYKDFDRKAIKRFPLNLACIASYVHKHDRHEVSCVDGDFNEFSIEETARAVAAERPDVVGFTATTAIMDIVLKVASLVKEAEPAVKIILGGPHVSAAPLAAAGHACVDAAVFGEGEKTFMELIETFQASGDLSGIAGIAYRDHDGPRMNRKRELITDLDTLPVPMWELFDYRGYHDFLIHGDEPYMVLTTSRGCPYDCIFCGSKTTWGRQVRSYSPGYVVAELADLSARGIHNISFVDDTFTVNKKRLKAICEGITDSGMEVNFLCASRVDTIDGEMLSWLKAAGCTMITFGVESADHDVLKTLKKRINLDQVREAITLTKAAGIRTHTSYIIGAPGETKQTVERTIAFALDMDPDYVQFSLFTPLPGTESWNCVDKAEQENFDYSRLRFYGSYVLDNPALPAEYLVSQQKEAYAVFNRRKGKAA